MIFISMLTFIVFTSEIYFYDSGAVYSAPVGSAADPSAGEMGGFSTR